MLLSNSPVKNVSERLSTFSQKSKISRLKFERKSDYRTFLNFIKNNTRELESIELPIEKKKPGLLLGAGLGLGLLLGFLGRGRDDDGSGQKQEGDSTTQLNTLKSVLEKAALESKRRDKQDRDTSRRLTTQSPFNTIKAYEFNRKSNKQAKNRIKNKIKQAEKIKELELENRKLERTNRRIKKRMRTREAELEKVRSENKKITVKDREMVSTSDGEKSSSETQRNMRKKIGVKQERGQTTTGGTRDRNMQKQVGDDSSQKSKSSTATLDKNQGKQGPTGGTGNRKQFFKSGSGDKLTNQDLKKLQIDQGAEEQIRDAKKIRLQDKLKIKSDIRRDRQEKANRASNVLDDFEADSKRRRMIEDMEIKRNKFLKFNRRVDRFTRGVNKINRFLSPISNFASAIYKPKNYLKFLLIKDMLKVEPFADGTLEGKPGVSFNPEKLMNFDKNTSVNIFMNSEGEESMIPFDPNIKTPIVSAPTDLNLPKNNVFVDVESNISEDFFFIKMAGS